MDIHKPKPIRNWREFLKEVGIIVLSICIALTAEQAVEWAHWRNEVSVARKALQEEITAIDRFYVRRIRNAPCAVRQEQEAEAILAGLEGQGKAATFTVFHHGSGTLMVDSEWQSERSAQVLTHFPRAELARMNRYYAMVPFVAAWIEAEGATWSELSVLKTRSARLESSDIARLRGQLDRAHRLNFLIVLNGTRMLKLSDQMGIARPKLEPGPLDTYCHVGDDKLEGDFLKAARQP